MHRTHSREPFLKRSRADTHHLLARLFSVRRGPLSFEHQGKTYSVNANNVASINVEAMPNESLLQDAKLVCIRHLCIGESQSWLYHEGILRRQCGW